MIGLAYCDKAGRIYFDEQTEPLADGGIIRAVDRAELIPAPAGTVEMILPGRRPLTRDGVAKRRYAMAVILPADTIGQTWCPLLISKLHDQVGNYDLALKLVF